MKTALYRHFDAAGVLLYVGISLSAMDRLAQHMRGSDWRDEIANVTVEWFPERSDALTAERIAIADEAPRFNQQHVPPQVALLPIAEPETAGPGGAMLAEWLRNNRIRQADLATALGVSQKHISFLTRGDAPSLDLAVKIEVITGGAIRATSFSRWSVLLPAHDAPSPAEIAA